MNKTCTVIITIYNREKLIIDTLNSIYNQTYRPIQLILIDDGSIDGTNIIVDKWVKNKIHDEFQIIFKTQKNKGAPIARNRALKLATGSFIQEVGSDDLIHHQKLEISQQFLQENPSFDSVWAPLKRFEGSEENELPNNIGKLEYSKVENNLKNPFLPEFMPSAGFHRSKIFFNTGPWNENLKRWQDLEYQVRMMNQISKYVKLNVPLYYFRQHNNGRINDQFNQMVGFDSGVISLESTWDSLLPNQRKNKDVKLSMFQFSFSLLQIASAHFDINKSKKAIYLMLKFSPDFKRKLKIHALLTGLKINSTLMFKQINK